MITHSQPNRTVHRPICKIAKRQDDVDKKVISERTALHAAMLRYSSGLLETNSSTGYTLWLVCQ